MERVLAWRRRYHSKAVKKNVLFLPLYSLGRMTGPPTDAPNSLRTRCGGLEKLSVRERATPMPLLRAVSNAEPCSVLVPDLVVMMKEPGRSIFAEELLVSE